MKNLKIFQINLFVVFATIFITSQTYSQDTRYHILFSARFASFRPFSIGGHAFTTWRTENISLAIETQFTYGFFPINGNGLFESTKSMLEQGYIKNSNKERLVRRLIIETDSIAFFESINQIKNWKYKLYNLLLKIACILLMILLVN